MKTIPRNKELNEVCERAEKRFNDEFINRQIELHKQAQAHRQQRDVEASAEMPSKTAESAD